MNSSPVPNGLLPTRMNLESRLREIPSLPVNLYFLCNLLVCELKILGIVLAQEIEERLSDVSEENDERIVELYFINSKIVV